MIIEIDLEVYVVVQIDDDGNPYLQGVYQKRSRADDQFDRVVKEDQLNEDRPFPGVYETHVRCAGDITGSVHMMKGRIK